jgi:shikimate kinase
MKPKAGSHPLGKPVRPSGGPWTVFLVGFMGAGKTSVGRRLSHRLGWDFEDLDDRIEKRERRLIAEIFREFGEAEFRRAEHAALRELIAQPGSSPRIVALGGGAFAQTKNAALLEESGAPVVFLDGPADELFRRCEQQNMERPLHHDAKQFRELYDRRRPFYLKAGWRVDTSGKDLDTIAAEVACSLGLQ